MTNKTVSETTSPNISGTEEGKEQSQRYSLSKFEYDLYHEEDDVAEKVIRVKRVSLPNKGERWKVFNDSKILFTIEGNKLSKREREFLQTIDGVNFMLAHAKSGFTSFNKFRAELKNKILNNSVVETMINTTKEKSTKKQK